MDIKAKLATTSKPELTFGSRQKLKWWDGLGKRNACFIARFQGFKAIRESKRSVAWAVGVWMTPIARESPTLVQCPAPHDGMQMPDAYGYHRCQRNACDENVLQIIPRTANGMLLAIQKMNSFPSTLFSLSFERSINWATGFSLACTNESKEDRSWCA